MARGAPTSGADGTFLNRRADELVGRAFVLDKPIVDGVGTVRVDDTVWRVSGDASWDRQFYLFDVEVYVPQAGRLVHNLVTDPYSANLSADTPSSGDPRSQFVNLAAADLKPEGWDTLAKPDLAAPDGVREQHAVERLRDRAQRVRRPGGRRHPRGRLPQPGPRDPLGGDLGHRQGREPAVVGDLGPDARRERGVPVIAHRVRRPDARCW